jgi:RNase P subunit RPR2
MQNQQRRLASFRADYRPPSCPNCSKLTSPTKRSPDYNLRYLRYERQVFTCPACGQQTERITDVDGNRPS